MRTRLPLILTALLLATAPVQAAESRPLLIVQETGQSRDGLPVLRSHPSAEQLEPVLSQGFSGRTLRLYQSAQTYLQKRTGSAPEPAYLLLSQNEGGFPRFGFYLGEEAKPIAGFVDLHESGSRSPTGHLGAMDQIFPHELAHVIYSQLAGGRHSSGNNQVHAVGVRTDPETAFDEGFAESMQIMAADDPEADPTTRAAAADPAGREAAEQALARYRRELSARWAPATRQRTTFPLWFSNTEQALRYHAVKANAFARSPSLSQELLTADPYKAYLLEATLPGVPSDPPRSAAQMLATEGVVSTLFHRWATNPQIQQAYLSDAFYQQFGADRERVSPLENAYLKLFHLFYEKKPQTAAEVIDGYKQLFPGEASAVDGLAQEVLLGQPIPTAPPLWLANPDFRTGSSLFDQFRAVPATHTFDLNSASLVDLVGIPGVGIPLAQAIIQAGPYQGLEEIQKVSGMTPALYERFRSMATAFDQWREVPHDVEASLNLNALLLPYLWRSAGALLLTALLAGLLYRWRMPNTPWLRAVANGLGAALLGLGLSWLIGPAGLMVPIALFGLPAGVYRLSHGRGWGEALRAMGAWVLATVPAVALGLPWF